jgi:hypothetical protein
MSTHFIQVAMCVDHLTGLNTIAEATVTRTYEDNFGNERKNLVYHNPDTCTFAVIHTCKGQATLTEGLTAEVAAEHVRVHVNVIRALADIDSLLVPSTGATT